jgi:uncharacterized protein (DUF2236 family)
MGIPDTDLPPTIVGLRSWMDEMVGSGRVRVTPAARSIARKVLYPDPRIPAIAWDAAHLISISTLRPELRGQYGIGWSPARERGMRAVAAATRRVLPFVPRVLRHVPHARSADRRVRRTR